MNSASRARWITGGVVLLVGILVVVLATRPGNPTDTPSQLVGNDAPTIMGTALDGASVDTASLRGRWLVVNFFATWCIPCRQEHPELIEFSRRHAEPGAPSNAPVVVAVAFDRTDIAATRSFFAQNGGDWPVVPDEQGTFAVGFGVRGLPESFVVSPDGKIVEQFAGAVTADALDAAIAGVA